MKRSLIGIALAGLILSGCNGVHNESNVSYDADAVEYEAPAVAEASAPTTESVPVAEIPEQKKIIKTGRMGIRVPRIDEAKRRVDSLTAIYQGYYADENYNDGYRYELALTIRVPFTRFDAFTAALEAGRGEVLYKTVSARDVSEEYLDVETRLANKRTYLERYREILRRATTIKEILEVEQHIRALEEEIESAQGRLRYLDSQTGYSTLELTLSTEQVSVPTRNKLWTRIKQALSSGWDGIVTFLVGLLYLWPFLLIGGGIWYWIHRRRKRKQELKRVPDRQVKP